MEAKYLLVPPKPRFTNKVIDKKEYLNITNESVNFNQKEMEKNKDSSYRISNDF